MRLRLAVPMLALLAACTPLGIWVYEEPKVEVRSVAVDSALGAAFPVRFTLAFSNANDYDVALLRVQVQLFIDGTTVVESELLADAKFPPRDRQVILIGIAPADLTPGARPNRFFSGDHQYTIQGYAILETPLGERKIPFIQSGRGAMSEASVTPTS